MKGFERPRRRRMSGPVRLLLARVRVAAARLPGRVRLFGAVVALGLTVAGSARVPAILAGMELFRVREVALEGARFLTAEDVARWISVPEETSVWSDAAPWEARLRSHPLVLEAEAGRDLPHTLVFRVVERNPVALVPTPTLEPVDSGGAVLPLDPAASRLDLPVIHGGERIGGEGNGREWAGGEPNGGEGTGGAGSAGVWSDDGRLHPADLRSLAREVARIEAADPAFFQALSELALGERMNEMVATLTDPAVRIRFRPPLRGARLKEGLRALEDAMTRRSGSVPASVDLRFADQVVVGFSPKE